MKFQVALVFGLLLCGALAPVLAEDEDVEEPEEDVDMPDERAALIAHKFVREGSVIHGQNATFVISLINVGRGYASAPLAAVRYWTQVLRGKQR